VKGSGKIGAGDSQVKDTLSLDDLVDMWLFSCHLGTSVQIGWTCALFSHLGHAQRISFDLLLWNDSCDFQAYVVGLNVLHVVHIISR
jgi:hypothetical protein